MSGQHEFYSAFSEASLEVARRKRAAKGPTATELRDARLRSRVAANEAGGQALGALMASEAVEEEPAEESEPEAWNTLYPRQK